MTILMQLVILGGIIGAVAIIMGGVLGFKVLPDVVNKKLKENVRLGQSETFRNWENPPFDVYIKISFFNVRNPNLIMLGNNASVEEIGPIIYKQRRRKKNVLYDANSDTFTYDQWVSNIYDPASPVKASDSVITLNVLKYLALLYVDESKLMGQLKNSFADVFPDTKNDDIFHSITIKDLLIDGYECLFHSTKDSFEARLLRNLVITKLNGNPRFKKTKQGYQFFVFRPEQKYMENTYEMQGGVKNISRQGNLLSINGANRLHIWPEWNESSHCNLVRGTDAYTFHPDFDTDSDLNVYCADLCRSLAYAFTKQVEVHDITAQHMILMSENFAYSTPENHNECFCIEDDKFVSCIEEGFLNLARCYNGIPLIASQPHFLYNNKIHAERLGLKPSLERDVSFIDIQTESGVVLRSSRKIQYNIWVHNVEGFAETIKPFMLPLFWIEEAMDIPDGYVKVLNKVYFDDLAIIEWMKWGLLVIGVVFLLTSVGAFTMSKVNLNFTNNIPLAVKK